MKRGKEEYRDEGENNEVRLEVNRVQKEGNAKAKNLSCLKRKPA